VDRILVVTNSLTGGGAERSMNLLVNELHSRGIVVALMPINKSKMDLVKPKCPIFPLHRNWNGNLFDLLRAYLKFLRYLKLWKPTVVILNCDLPEFVGALSLKLVPRIIVVEHTNHPFASRIFLGKWIRKILKKMNAEFVAVSQHLDIWQISTKAKKVLLNAINIDSKQMAEPNQSQHVQLRNVVYVGRLATIQKRPQIMLEIAKTIQNKVIIIGEGEAKEEIELRVLKESLNVEMLGYIENPWELLDQSDLLIVPSLFEGDGMVVIEALERDLPILLSDIPDFRRFNLSSSNYCVDSIEFVRRIEEYEFRINELKVPLSIRKEILNTRNPKVVGDSWVSFLDQNGY